MTHEQQAALPFERAAARVAGKTTEAQSTRPPGQDRPTQYARVLAVLLERDEVCGSELYAMYIPRFGAHLHRMKKACYQWSKRPCDRHDHHEGTGWLYKLESLPYDPSGAA